MKTKSILVLYGGNSNEREVSLRSGQNVAEHVRAAGFAAKLLDTADVGFDLAAACQGVDVVVPMLHGAGGEDGSLQHELDKLGVPYFGSGEAACALTWNKVACKERLAEQGILTPAWEVVDRAQFETAGLRQNSYVLKPIAGGSTIDTLIVHNPGHQAVSAATIDQLFKRYKRMLLEELVEGQEITIPVLGEKALPIILIVPPTGEEFDYANKYNGRTQEIAHPHEISPAVQRQAQRLAQQVHGLTGCRHISRTDVIIARSGAMYVLEVNTIPGMTAQSLVPNAAASAGLSMTELAKQFIEMAVAGRR